MIEQLRRDGIVTIPPMSRSAALEMTAYLADRAVYDGHVKQDGRPPCGSGVTCWSMDDVVTAPHLMEFALSLTERVGTYLDAFPRMYSVNAFTTFPKAGPLNPDVQEFHRDRDDSQFLALFVYLSDVVYEEQGAHQFQAGTHAGQVDNPDVLTIMGPAGTAFLADTRGLHRGVRPTECPRSIAWVRWGVSDPPPSYRWDRLAPVDSRLLGSRYPDDPMLRETLKWVVQ